MGTRLALLVFCCSSNGGNLQRKQFHHFLAHGQFLSECLLCILPVGLTVVHQPHVAVQSQLEVGSLNNNNNYY